MAEEHVPQPYPLLHRIEPETKPRWMLNPRTERLHLCCRTGNVIVPKGERKLYSALTLCKRRDLYQLTRPHERMRYAWCLICEARR